MQVASVTLRRGLDKAFVKVEVRGEANQVGIVGSCGSKRSFPLGPMCLFALPGTTTKSKQTNTIALFIGLFASDCLYGTQARMRGWHTPAGTPAYPGRYPGIPRPLAPTLYPLALALALPLALALGLPTWAEQVAGSWTRWS